MLEILEKRNFPVRNLYPLGSSRPAGASVEFNGQDIIVADHATFGFVKGLAGVYPAGGDGSAVYALEAGKAGSAVSGTIPQVHYAGDILVVEPGGHRRRTCRII